jgi:hypothetical protein
MRLRGSAPAATPIVSDLLAAKMNYLVGSAPSQWRTGVSSYSRVGYRGVYSGIDVIYYEREGMLEYDFRVAAGSDPRAIRMTYSGMSRLRIESNGDLVLETAAGEIRHHRPVIYQEFAGTRREVDGRYRIRSRREVGFEIGAYDQTRPLTIDPVVTYATYLGGSKSDAGRGIAVDAAGNVFVSGTTFSADLPASTGALQTSFNGVQDVFISKLEAKGNLAFTTYLGGNDGESVAGLALDPQGNIIVAGYTSSSNFPTSDNTLQKFNRGGFFVGSDGYLTKLDPTGSKLVYSSYIGGNDDELLQAFTVDRAGFVYLTGTTASTNFPTTVNAYQKGNRSLAAFVSKVDTQSGQFVYSTYVGGSMADVPHAIAVDSSGSAYVCGYTSSSDFPTTTGALQTTFRGGSVDKDDGFVFKLDAQGSHLTYSTFLGGTDDDSIDAIAVDSAGNAYVGGYTYSSNFPLTNGALQSTLVGVDESERRAGWCPREGAGGNPRSVRWSGGPAHLRVSRTGECNGAVRGRFEAFHGVAGGIQGAEVEPADAAGRGLRSGCLHRRLERQGTGGHRE